ncbi:unnamed protein product [Closterium sp. NIES-54]
MQDLSRFTALPLISPSFLPSLPIHPPIPSYQTVCRTLLEKGQLGLSMQDLARFTSLFSISLFPLFHPVFLLPLPCSHSMPHPAGEGPALPVHAGPRSLHCPPSPHSPPCAPLTPPNRPALPAPSGFRVLGFLPPPLPSPSLRSTLLVLVQHNCTGLTSQSSPRSLRLQGAEFFAPLLTTLPTPPAPLPRHGSPGPHTRPPSTSLCNTPSCLACPLNRFELPPSFLAPCKPPASPPTRPQTRVSWPARPPSTSLCTTPSCLALPTIVTGPLACTPTLYIALHHSILSVPHSPPPPLPPSHTGPLARTPTLYIALQDSILPRLRFPKFMAQTNELLGDEAEAVVEALLEHGRLSLHQLVQRSVAKAGSSDPSAAKSMYARALKGQEPESMHVCVDRGSTGARSPVTASTRAAISGSSDLSAAKSKQLVG